MTRRLVDTGLLGWLDIGTYARYGPGQRDRLSSAQVAFIARTVRRAPEVMVKMLNQGGRDLGSVARHLEYLRPEGGASDRDR
jgi:predicted unusual protein kinase regulating ubiquinone biosynthesis (AarF/ABC1/UbiB family)